MKRHLASARGAGRAIYAGGYAMVIVLGCVGFLLRSGYCFIIALWVYGNSERFGLLVRYRRLVP